MIRKLARQVLSPLQSLYRQPSGPTILLYHRIANAVTDGNHLCVSPEHFRQQLETLARSYQILPLVDLVEQWNSGTAPNNAVALTFDDGYRDSLDVAYPLLVEFDAPATFFLATGRLEKERDYWWDELERVVLRVPSLPDHLALRIGSRTQEWWSGPGWDSSTLRGRLGDVSSAPSKREQLFAELVVILINLPEQERLDVQDQLVTWAVSTNEAREPVLSREQVGFLGNADLVDIGAHSVSHPKMTLLGAAQQAAEMQKSKEWLESATNKPVRTFAYPYGFYDRRSIEAARTVGFEAACACDIRRVTLGPDLLHLPRHMACDVDGDQFARCLSPHPRRTETTPL